jgi:hypothetical protein
MLNDCSLIDNRADSVLWALDKKNQFTTKSMYRFLTDRGANSRVAGFIWKSKVPLKIKFFLWQLLNNRLQTAENLATKGWKGSILCCLCGCLETMDHIFFKCHLTVLVWETICVIFQLSSYPKSWEDFCGTWLQGKGPVSVSLTMFIFSGFAWALWTTRNKIAIDKKFLKAPTDVIYIAISLMQKWSVKLKEKDQERLKQIKDSITSWLKTFKPSIFSLSDVIEI